MNPSKKVCPTCKTGNAIYEVRCQHCFRDISKVSSAFESSLSAIPAKERGLKVSAPRDDGGAIGLSTPDGKYLSVSDGDILGRGAVGKDMLKPFEGISRRHAQFLNKDGAWFLVDLGSSNGTFIDSKKIEPKRQYPVQNGTMIKFSPHWEAVVTISGHEHAHIESIEDAPDHDRKIMIVMFGDLKGSVNAFQEMGTMMARSWIQSLFRVFSNIIDSYNGKHLKNIGDALLAVFEDPCDALSAVQDMQFVIKEHNARVDAREQYHMRIGLNLGKVVLETSDVFGNAVNIASRIQDITPPDRIYISEPLYNAIKNKKGFSVNFVGDKSLKGVKENIGVYEVVWPN